MTRRDVLTCHITTRWQVLRELLELVHRRSGRRLPRKAHDLTRHSRYAPHDTPKQCTGCAIWHPGTMSRQHVPLADESLTDAEAQQLRA
jgi:hypothetical protein